MGREYVAQHCIWFIQNKYDERRYRAYITNALYAIAENTAHMYGGQVMTGRWYDAYAPVDDRTGDEIAADVIRGAGLIPKGGG